MQETFNKARALFRLPPYQGSCRETPLLGDLFLLRTVPELEVEVESLPPRVHLVGSCLWEPEETDPELEIWLAQAKASGRPLIYVQHGRFFHLQGFWRKLVEVFGGTEWWLAASVDRLDSEIGELPPNFFVRPHIPQGRILQQSSIMVSGANTTSVLGALEAGVPSLLIPGGGEQPDIAALAERAGVAVKLGVKEASTDSILEAVRTLLTEPRFRERAENYRSAFLKQDGFQAVPDLLERLGTTREPVLRATGAGFSASRLLTA